MKRFSIFALLTFVVLVAAQPVFAQAAPAAAASHWHIITIGFAMALASSVCGLAQGRAISAACESLARNPGAAAVIRFALLLGLVLIESLALYTLLISFMLYFKLP